jgi:hypothetical protein
MTAPVISNESEIFLQSYFRKKGHEGHEAKVKFFRISLF